MSIDVLQEKIRKLKCPIIVDFGVQQANIPPHLLEDASILDAYDAFCRELMNGLKGIVPGVRFSFDQFALMGENALKKLSELLTMAADSGYYVLLDGPAVPSPWAAERTADYLLADGSRYPCDGLVVSPYIGTDAIKPFVPYCKEGDKSVFFAVRSPNKTASEIQDLMTGSRLVHTATADIVNRQAEAVVGKSGYSSIAALTAATNANAVTWLRNNYKKMFLLVDGYDYPGGNAKNCSYGFDQFGHGCAVSIGPAVVSAWMETESESKDFVSCAVQAAERINKNLNRYIAIL